MPVSPRRARNFKVITDFPIDTVVFTSRTRSVFVADPTFFLQIDIPHGLPFRPLPMVVWSFTPDFSVSFIRQDTSGTIFLNVGAPDATNISITISNIGGGNKTIYYRIFAFPPSTINSLTDVAPTASNADRFTLNSDRNYLKLVKAGVLSTSDRIYNHNLGYIPSVWTWLNSTREPNVLAQWVIPDPAGTAGIKVTENTIEFVGSSVNDTSIEYRIYADGLYG